MIGFVVRELSYLKILQPIIEYIKKLDCKVKIYNMINDKGEKNYNKPTKERIDKSFGYKTDIFSFYTDGQLLELLKKDKISKLVSLEIGLWGKKYFKFFNDNNIKTFSILYLSDSLWYFSDCSYRIYYTTEHLMRCCHKFNKIKFNSNRDRCFGSPIFDQLEALTSNSNDICVMLPNKCDYFLKNPQKFYNLIESFGNNLIFKLRKKQWLPEEIKKFAKEIVYDGDIMYPSSISDIFRKTKYTVMFYSSGIYEAVFGNQSVINIKFPLNTWPHNSKMMEEYFNDELYNFPGVVQSFTINDRIEISDNQEKRKEWIKRFIGFEKAESIKLISEDILRG